MKNKIKKILIFGIILILLFPIVLRYKDGGSIAFKAILYEVTKFHQLDFDSETGYKDALSIKILGIEIYNNTK